MAICGLITAGQDFACITEISKEFEQKMVIINSDEIDTTTVVKTVNTQLVHKVAFALKTGKTGYAVELPSSGGSIFGTFSKANSDYGFAQYTHIVNFASIGLSEATLAFLRTLDKGNFLIALKVKGTNEVIIFGISNGLITGDYTYDIVAGSGGSAITLTSKENATESLPPLVFTSTDPIASFEMNFAN